MTIWIVGSLNYHNETIVGPIIDKFKEKHLQYNWFKPDNGDGANVHISEFTNQTIKYWMNFNALGHRLQKNDIVLVLDFWNPTIFDLKFYSTRNNLNIKFFTIHHGSSHLPGDFASQPGYEWAYKFEQAWTGCYEKIFFGSYNALDQFDELEPGQGVVSYLPIKYIEDIKKDLDLSTVVRDPKSVVMPLRLDDDKGVYDFYKIVKNNPGYNFHASLFHAAATKLDAPNIVYHDAMDRPTMFALMASCEYVVSCAKQETFGYAVLEAVSMGCKPILQNSTDNCYSEMYEDSSLFIYPELVKIEDYENSAGLIPSVLKTPAEEIIVRGMLF
jgi:hypothetical protein